MGTVSNGTVALSADVSSAIDQATSQATSAPAAVPSPLVPGGLPGGVSAMPIDASTWLQITVQPNLSPVGGSNNISLTITARILQKDGTLAYCRWDQTVNLATGLVYASDLAPGYLLSVVVTCNSTVVADGLVYVIIGLVHQPGGGLPLDTVLIASYLTYAVPVGWPCGILRILSDGNGIPVVYSPTDPPLGTGLTFTVQDHYFLLTGLYLTFTTSSTVQNRYVLVEEGPTTTYTLCIGNSQTAQTASQSITYIFGSGINSGANSASGKTYCSLTESVTLSYSNVLFISADFIQSGDQLSSIFIFGRAWL